MVHSLRDPSSGSLAVEWSGAFGSQRGWGPGEKDDEKAK